MSELTTCYFPLTRFMSSYGLIYQMFGFSGEFYVSDKWKYTEKLIFMDQRQCCWKCPQVMFSVYYFRDLRFAVYFTGLL